jgi:hypothetical protein
MFPPGSRCRRARSGSGVVVWVPLSAPTAVCGLGCALRALGCSLLEPGFLCAGGVALYLACPPRVQSAFLAQLPRLR